MLNEKDTIRLEKYLALAGIASRRSSKEIVKSGRVTVNDKKVFTPGMRIMPDIDSVKLDGEEVTISQKLVYIMLNKPKGYVCTVHDERGRHTVFELLPNLGSRIYPIGRLDMDTEGLLLLTNDGELTHKLTHPRYHVDKVYIAYVEGKPDEYALDKLRKGVRIKGGLTSPAEVSVLKKVGTKQRKRASLLTQLKITIHEGRKRQIRRMCRKIGYEVLYLKRIQIGQIKLDGLAVGKYRFLSKKEIEKLHGKKDIE